MPNYIEITYAENGIIVSRYTNSIVERKWIASNMCELNEVMERLKLFSHIVPPVEPVKIPLPNNTAPTYEVLNEN